MAFVEEPFALSKNATGLLLTLGMVIGAALCCTAMRALARRAARSGYKSTHKEDEIEPPRDGDEEDSDGDDEDDEPSGRR